MGDKYALEWGRTAPPPNRNRKCTNIKSKNLTFSSLYQNMATNKKILYLNISQSYRNYAMPYMNPTYPENIRLLGPSTWEEIGNQQTNRQTAHRNSTPLSRIMHVANC